MWYQAMWNVVADYVHPRGDEVGNPSSNKFGVWGVFQYVFLWVWI